MFKHKDSIIALLVKGKSNNEIANSLPCSKGTVSYHRRKLFPEKHSISVNIQTKNGSSSRIRYGTITCIWCGKAGKYGAKKYCSIKCSQSHIKSIYVDKVENGLITGNSDCGIMSAYVRNNLFEIRDAKCELCGWSQINPTTNVVPVQVHHIDGNYENNKQANLQLLCPNCHSLTPTYGALNKGNGRAYRYAKK